MISIIIVNYKNNERTIKYVKEELIKVQTEHRIIVVNNEATASSNQELGKDLDAIVLNLDDINVKDSKHYVISNPENSGFAKGNNIGARFALKILKSEYLLFSNNDIKFLDADVVEKLVNKFKQLPKAGIIGPKVMGLDGKLQSPEPYVSFWDRNVWMYLSTPFYSKEKKIERFCLDYSQNAQEGFHYKLMGSFFMVRSSDFLKCGMFDEHTFLYAEEPILTERMRRIGLKPYFYPQVAVLHDHGATTKKHFGSGKLGLIKFESECYYYHHYCHTPNWQIWIAKIVRTLLKIMQ